MSLAAIIGELHRRVAEIERRQDGAMQQGTVAEVDAKAGTVRIRLGGDDQAPFLSPPIPYAQIAGGLKVHTPPTVGQQMTVINHGGDFRQGLALPMTWSDANGAPSDKGDENVLTFGSVRIELRGDEIVVQTPKLRIECGGVSQEITSGGVKIEGGKVEHDGKNIGATHIHSGVTPGGGTSGPPAN